MNNNLFMKHWKIRIGMKDQYFEVNTRTDVCLTVLAQWVAQLWSSLAQEFQSDLDEGYGLWSFNHLSRVIKVVCDWPLV